MKLGLKDKINNLIKAYKEYGKAQGDAIKAVLEPFKVPSYVSRFTQEGLERTIKEEMDDILDKIGHQSFDYVFTHTCPEDWQPTDLFLSGINQSKVSKRMEQFLTTVSGIIDFKHWYFGHFHDDRENIDYNPTHSGQGNVSMLFNKIVRIM